MTWVGWRLLGLGGNGNDSNALELGGVKAERGSLGRSFGSLRGAMVNRLDEREVYIRTKEQQMVYQIIGLLM